SSSDNLAQTITNGSTLTINATTITFSTAQTNITGSPPAITIGMGAGSTVTVAQVLAQIDSVTGASGPTASKVSGGELVISTGTGSSLTIGSTTGNALTALGLVAGTTPRGGGGTAGTGTVTANDLTTFTNESISGGAVTAYNAAGTPVNLQLRWAKTD